jgi:hypothetical protein
MKLSFALLLMSVFRRYADLILLGAALGVFVILHLQETAWAVAPLLFILIGNGHFLRRLLGKKFVISNRHDPLFPLILNLALGFLMLMALSIGLARLHLLSYSSLLFGLGLTSIGMVGLSFWRTPQKPPAFQFSPLGLGLSLILVAGGVMAMTYVRSLYEWPLFAGLDHFLYMPSIHRILENHGLSELFLNHNLTQPHSYYLTLGALFELSHVSFLNFFYYGPYLSLSIYALTMFSWAHTVFKDRWTSLWAGLMALTLVGGFHFYGAHDVYSTSVTQLLFLIIWLWLLRCREAVSLRQLLLVGLPFFILIGLAYPFTILINLPLLTLLLPQRLRGPLFMLSAGAMSFVLLFKGPRVTAVFDPLLWVALGFFIVAFLIRYLSKFKPLLWQLLLGASVFTVLISLWSTVDTLYYPHDPLVALIFTSYSKGHLALAGLGLFLIISLLIQRRFRPKLEGFFPGAYYFLGALLPLFLFGYSHFTTRSEWNIRPFLILLSCVPIYVLSFTLKKHWRRWGLMMVTIPFVLSLHVAPALPLSQIGFFEPLYRFRTGQEFAGGALSGLELEVLEFIATEIPPTAYIITDPYMGIFIRGYADRRASNALVIDNGDTPSVSGRAFQTLKEANFDWLWTLNVDGEVDQYLLDLMQRELNAAGFEVDRFYMVVNGRTGYWLGNNDRTDVNNRLNTYGYWPIVLQDYIGGHLSDLSSHPDITIVFQNESSYVAEIDWSKDD